MTLEYSAPLPYDFVATKQDCSPDKEAVKQLQKEFGFEYSSVIGMLIYLMNTAYYLHFAISKLVKFNNLPGRVHFKVLKHLLMHLACNRLRCGVTFYSDVGRSPIYQLIKENTDASPKAPIIMFTDSSWQDCPDTGRSTGCYQIYQQGGIVEAASFVPNPVAMSSAESEYNAVAHAMQRCANVRQILQELSGNAPDTPLNIPVLCDSESALIIGQNNKDTKRTRHIQRLVHYVREALPHVCLMASRSWVPSTLLMWVPRTWQVMCCSLTLKLCTQLSFPDAMQSLKKSVEILLLYPIFILDIHMQA